jgi:hypothetical protein
MNRNNLLMLPVQINDTAPFTRPPRPLSACRLAIVTTAGLLRRSALEGRRVRRGPLSPPTDSG